MTSSSVKLTLKKRSKTGKEVSKKLRAGGVIPAVFYGPELDEAIPVTEAGLEAIRFFGTFNAATTLPSPGMSM